MAKDTSGIPDVDLSGVKDQLENDYDGNDPKSTDLGQFKTPEDLLNAYKEIQGAFTRVSQENKALKEKGGNPDKVAELEAQLQSMREEAELMRLQSQPQANTGAKSFDESWMQSPEATIDERVEAKLAIARINDVLEEENMKNPEEYPQRYKEADALATRYPQLARSPQGVRKLFKMADEIRNRSMRQMSAKTLEYLFGETPSEEQLAKLKEFVIGGKKQTKSNNDAYMPDSSTSTRRSSDEDATVDQRRIEKAAKSGDVDGVLGEMFRDILA